MGLYYLQSRYYNPEVGRFINADAFAATGQGLLGNNIFAYCGNNPICRIDSFGTAYEDVADDYRTVGAGIQLELDFGNITVGFEIIIYWDVDECSENEYVMAVYTYSGGSVDMCDELLGSITATIRDNINLLTSGSEESISALVSLLKGKYSASVSGLLLWGSEEFISVSSYEGPFLSMYGSISHVKGALAISSNCVAIAIGGTSSNTPSWGISLTNYHLHSALKIGKPTRIDSVL